MIIITAVATSTSIKVNPACASFGFLETSYEKFDMFVVKVYLRPVHRPLE